VVLGLVAIYYLYKYLFQDVKKNVILVNDKLEMNTKTTLISANRMPAFVEGGDYTISFWMYIQDMIHKNGVQKHVMTLGSPLSGSTGFESLAVYLGATQPSLHIRTQNSDIVNNVTASVPNLTASHVASLFNDASKFSATEIRGADIPMVDMQRWVNVTIVLSGRTTDVYLDGKLIRSTVNQGVFRVPSTGYQLELGYNGGFGGQLTRLQTFDYAVNPAEAYRIYVNGPFGALNALDWLKSIFAPPSV
jgi:hypothetical protein